MNNLLKSYCQPASVHTDGSLIEPLPPSLGPLVVLESSIVSPRSSDDVLLGEISVSCDAGTSCEISLAWMALIASSQAFRHYKQICRYRFFMPWWKHLQPYIYIYIHHYACSTWNIVDIYFAAWYKFSWNPAHWNICRL